MNIKKKKNWVTTGYEEIISKGFGEFNVDELSSKLNTAKTSFYHYHGSREEFVEEVIRYWGTEKWEEVQLSLQTVASSASTEAFIKHKKSYIDFYCFLILIKRHSGISKGLKDLSDKVEAKLRHLLEELVSAVRGEKALQRNYLEFLCTYLFGWDFLNAFNVFHKRQGYTHSLHELKQFMDSQQIDKHMREAS